MRGINTSCGPTSPAFFVGRSEIINWINNTLQLNPPIQKIEETSTGCVWCQICHMIWPNTPLHRVRWNAKSDDDKINNFKILQHTLKVNNIPNHVPIESLIGGKFQENLAFAQIMKYILEPLTLSRINLYDPVQERVNSRSRQPVGISMPSADRVKLRKPPVADIAPYVQQIEKLNTMLTETQEAYHIAENEKIFYYEKLLAIEAVLQDEVFLKDVGTLVEEVNRVLAADGSAQ